MSREKYLDLLLCRRRSWTSSWGKGGNRRYPGARNIAAAASGGRPRARGNTRILPANRAVGRPNGSSTILGGRRRPAGAAGLPLLLFHDTAGNVGTNRKRAAAAARRAARGAGMMSGRRRLTRRRYRNSTDDSWRRRGAHGRRRRRGARLIQARDSVPAARSSRTEGKLGAKRFSSSGKCAAPARPAVCASGAAGRTSAHHAQPGRIDDIDTTGAYRIQVAAQAHPERTHPRNEPSQNLIRPSSSHGMQNFPPSNTSTFFRWW